MACKSLTGISTVWWFHLKKGNFLLGLGALEPSRKNIQDSIMANGGFFIFSELK